MTGSEELVYWCHYSKHTHLVVIAWKLIRDFLFSSGVITDEEYEKINNHIIWHDNSKIDEDEWAPYVRKFGSHEPLSDEEKLKFKEAVKRHKQKNLHHYESLRDYKGDDWRCYIIEMICDYIAMGWEFDNYIFEYYESVKEKIDLPQEYKEYFESVLSVLRSTSMHYIEEPITEDVVVELF